MTYSQLKALFGADDRLNEVCVGEFGEEDRAVLCMDDDGERLLIYTYKGGKASPRITVRDIYGITPAYIPVVINNIDDGDYDAHDDDEVEGLWYYKDTLMIEVKEAHNMTVYGFTIVDSEGELDAKGNCRESETSLYITEESRQKYAEQTIKDLWMERVKRTEDEDGQTLDEVLEDYSTRGVAYIALPFDHLRFENFTGEVK